MKIEIRKEPVISNTKVYITEDGKEFTREYDAKLHESRILEGTRKIKTHYYKTFDENYAQLWYITCPEDLDYVERVHLLYYYEIDKYDEPGWYMTVCNYGGDGPDSHDIYKVNNYLKELEERLNELKDLTSE